MRYLNGFFCVIMILFVAVQYNDPDYAFWMVIYGISAVWAGVAALRPAVLARDLYTAGLILTTAAAVAGTVYYWPTVPGWWRKDVWWNEETAREGMGMMIVTVTLLVVLVTAWRARSRTAAAD
jgi:hypothetical protein